MFSYKNSDGTDVYLAPKTSGKALSRVILGAVKKMTELNGGPETQDVDSRITKLNALSERWRRKKAELSYQSSQDTILRNPYLSEQMIELLHALKNEFVPLIKIPQTNNGTSVKQDFVKRHDMIMNGISKYTQQTTVEEWCQFAIEYCDFLYKVAQLSPERQQRALGKFPLESLGHYECLGGTLGMLGQARNVACSSPHEMLMAVADEHVSNVVAAHLYGIVSPNNEKHIPAVFAKLKGIDGSDPAHSHAFLEMSASVVIQYLQYYDELVVKAHLNEGLKHVIGIINNVLELDKEPEKCASVAEQCAHYGIDINRYINIDVFPIEVKRKEFIEDMLRMFDLQVVDKPFSIPMDVDRFSSKERVLMRASLGQDVKTFVDRLIKDPADVMIQSQVLALTLRKGGNIRLFLDVCKEWSERAPKTMPAEIAIKYNQYRKCYPYYNVGINHFGELLKLASPLDELKMHFVDRPPLVELRDEELLNLVSYLAGLDEQRCLDYLSFVLKYKDRIGLNFRKLIDDVIAWQKEVGNEVVIFSALSSCSDADTNKSDFNEECKWCVKRLIKNDMDAALQLLQKWPHLLKDKDFLLELVDICGIEKIGQYLAFVKASTDLVEDIVETFVQETVSDMYFEQGKGVKLLNQVLHFARNYLEREFYLRVCGYSDGVPNSINVLRVKNCLISTLVCNDIAVIEDYWHQEAKVEYEKVFAKLPGISVAVIRAVLLHRCEGDKINTIFSLLFGVSGFESLSSDLQKLIQLALIRSAPLQVIQQYVPLLTKAGNSPDVWRVALERDNSGIRNNESAANNLEVMKYVSKEMGPIHYDQQPPLSYYAKQALGEAFVVYLESYYQALESRLLADRINIDDVIVWLGCALDQGCDELIDRFVEKKVIFGVNNSKICEALLNPQLYEKNRNKWLDFYQNFVQKIPEFDNEFRRQVGEVISEKIKNIFLSTSNPRDVSIDHAHLRSYMDMVYQSVKPHVDAINQAIDRGDVQGLGDALERHNVGITIATHDSKKFDLKVVNLAQTKEDLPLEHLCVHPDLNLETKIKMVQMLFGAGASVDGVPCCYDGQRTFYETKHELLACVKGSDPRSQAVNMINCVFLYVDPEFWHGLDGLGASLVAVDHHFMRIYYKHPAYKRNLVEWLVGVDFQGMVPPIVMDIIALYDDLDMVKAAINNPSVSTEVVSRSFFRISQLMSSHFFVSNLVGRLTLMAEKGLRLESMSDGQIESIVSHGTPERQRNEIFIAMREVFGRELLDYLAGGGETVSNPAWVQWLAKNVLRFQNKGGKYLFEQAVDKNKISAKQLLDCLPVNESGLLPQEYDLSAIHYGVLHGDEAFMKSLVEYMSDSSDDFKAEVGAIRDGIEHGKCKYASDQEELNKIEQKHAWLMGHVKEYRDVVFQEVEVDNKEFRNAWKFAQKTVIERMVQDNKVPLLVGGKTIFNLMHSEEESSYVKIHPEMRMCARSVIENNIFDIELGLFERVVSAQDNNDFGVFMRYYLSHMLMSVNSNKNKEKFFKVIETMTDGQWEQFVAHDNVLTTLFDYRSRLLDKTRTRLDLLITDKMAKQFCQERDVYRLVQMAHELYEKDSKKLPQIIAMALTTQGEGATCGKMPLYDELLLLCPFLKNAQTLSRAICMGIEQCSLQDWRDFAYLFHQLIFERFPSTNADYDILVENLNAAGELGEYLLKTQGGLIESILLRAVIEGNRGLVNSILFGCSSSIDPDNHEGPLYVNNHVVYGSVPLAFVAAYDGNTETLEVILNHYPQQAQNLELYLDRMVRWSENSASMDYAYTYHAESLQDVIKWLKAWRLRQAGSDTAMADASSQDKRSRKRGPDEDDDLGHGAKRSRLSEKEDLVALWQYGLSFDDLTSNLTMNLSYGRQPGEDVRGWFGREYEKLVNDNAIIHKVLSAKSLPYTPGWVKEHQENVKESLKVAVGTVCNRVLLSSCRVKASGEYMYDKDTQVGFLNEILDVAESSPFILDVLIGELNDNNIPGSGSLYSHVLTQDNDALFLALKEFFDRHASVPEINVYGVRFYIACTPGTRNEQLFQGIEFINRIIAGKDLDVMSLDAGSRISSAQVSPMKEMEKKSL